MKSRASTSTREGEGADCGGRAAVTQRPRRRPHDRLELSRDVAVGRIDPRAKGVHGRRHPGRPAVQRRRRRARPARTVRLGSARGGDVRHPPQRGHARRRHPRTHPSRSSTTDAARRADPATATASPDCVSAPRPSARSSRRAATPVLPSSCGRADHPRIDPSIDERPTMTIRLLIADDRAMVRGALAALLDLESDLEVVAEVGRGDEVLDACCEHAPSSCRRAPCATTCRLRSARRADAPAQTPSASRRRTGGCERDPLHTYRAVNLVVFGNVVS